MKNIIFDLDGTLVDSAPLIAGIINEMLRERGSSRVVEASDARACLTRGGAQLVTELLGSTSAEIALDLARFRALYMARPTPPACLFPGVGDGLRALSRLGVRMAICSNKPQALCDKIVADLSMNVHCAIVVGSVAGVPLKPAPDLARLALAKLSATPEECLYVGDSGVDRQTAENAGVPFLFVTYGYAEPGVAIDARARFDCFDDLVRFVSDGQDISSARRQVA